MVQRPATNDHFAALLPKMSALPWRELPSSVSSPNPTRSSRRTLKISTQYIHAYALRMRIKCAPFRMTRRNDLWLRSRLFALRFGRLSIMRHGSYGITQDDATILTHCARTTLRMEFSEGTTSALGQTSCDSFDLASFHAKAFGQFLVEIGIDPPLDITKRIRGRVAGMRKIDREH